MGNRLTRPSADLETAYRLFADELAAAGDGSFAARLRVTAFAAYVAKCDGEARGEGLAPGLVPMSIFWLLDESGQIHGELRLRHCLTPRLEQEGGHIGYTIRPSSRRQGYGKEILRLGLAEARALGLERVLVTCDDENVGSYRIIEANGGRDYSLAISEFHGGKPIRRYWIDLK